MSKIERTKTFSFDYTMIVFSSPLVSWGLLVYSIHKVILLIQIYSFNISALLSKSNTIIDRRRLVSRL